MRTKTTLLASVISASLLTACGGGGDMLSRSDSETHKLTPEVVVEDPLAARPSENAPVLRTDGTNIMWTDGKHYVLPVGIELDYGADSTERFNAISELAKVSAGAVRLVLTPQTPVQNLEAALNRALTEGLFVNVTLNDPALYCKDNGEELLRLAKETWFGKFRPIIAQDKYQSIMMISLARGWGPKEVFDPTSSGYREYMDYTKTLIRDFRKAGFRLPLVIEAPGCGEDFNAFDANRVRELLAADTQKNLIFGLAAKGKTYNTSAKISNAVNVIRGQRAPVIFTEVGGSDVVEKGAKAEQVLSGAFGDVALSVNPQWQGPGDKIAYLFPFDSPKNLKSTQLSFDINFADAYLANGAAGSMGYQLYLRDINDNYANIQWNEVKNATTGWNSFTYKIGASMPKTGWVSDGFDMTQVAAVGVELVAQDKPASVAGPIKFDNFKLIEGTGPAVVYASDFSAGVDGWKNSHYKAEELNTVAVMSTADGDQAGKALSLVPQSDVFEITRTGLAVDLTQPFTITARIFIPASITNFGMGVFAANSTQWAGGGWGGTWNLKPGQWNDYSFTPSTVNPPPENPGDEPKPSEAEQFAASGGNSLGFQFSQFVAGQNKGDAILIENVQIVSAAGAAAETELGVQYRSDFSASADGWGNTAWPDDNGVSSSPVLTPENGELVAASSKDGIERISLQKNNLTSLDSLNLGEGFKVTVNVFIPESLRNTEFNFQMFFQDANWGHHNSPIDMTGDDLKYGEWMTITVEPDFPPGFDLVGTPKFVGIDMFARKGAGGFKTTDEVIIGSILFEGQVPIEPEEVVLGAVDFNRGFDVFVDFVDGAITEAQALIVAADVISRPYGWFASTWFATDPDDAAYDLVSDLKNASTLTERGELIVNTPGGLAEMRSLLVPEKPVVAPAVK